MRKYMLKNIRKTTQHKYKHQITPSNKQKTEILNMAPVYQGGCQPFSLHKPVPYQNLELHSFMSKTALLARSSHNSQQDLKCQDILAQGGLSVAGRCRCLTKDSNTSIEKEGYIPYSLQA